MKINYNVSSIHDKFKKHIMDHFVFFFLPQFIFKYCTLMACLDIRFFFMMPLSVCRIFFIDTKICCFAIALVPSMIIQTPRDLNITQGLSGTFHCKARGHPAPRIAWASGRNGDLPMPSDDRYKILPGGSLMIVRVNMSDAGLYRCIASNPAGSSTAAARLRVQG